MSHDNTCNNYDNTKAHDSSKHLFRENCFSHGRIYITTLREISASGL